MLQSDAVGLAVNLLVEVHDAETGALVGREELHNLVVDAGLNLLRDFLDGDAPGPPTHFAVGTGTTATAAAQTALVAETFRDTITQRIPTAKQEQYRYYLSSLNANGATLAEVGLFTASSGGTMFARAKLSSTIAKTSSITATFTWTIGLAAVEA
jgi:tartrate dehydratase alpha subunit/fumarate hydratase class I-like protein